MAYTNSGPVVGYEAVEQAASNPKNTIYDIKYVPYDFHPAWRLLTRLARRLLGQRWTNGQLQDHIKTLNCDVVQDEKQTNSLAIKTKTRWGSTKLYSPEEVTSEIIKTLKTRAEAYLKEEVKHAVITVPDSFNDDQRQATKEAAALVGLNALRLLKEPWAAGMAYGLDRDIDERLVVVYDIGPKASEVTLHSIDHGVFETLTGASDAQLGGEDIKGSLFVPSHNAAPPATEKVIKLVERLLKDGKEKKTSIEGVVLTGDPRHAALIKPILSSYFAGKKIYDGIRSDEAVIRGAAIQAEIYSAPEGPDEPYLVDTIPLSMWVETTGGVLKKVIDRHTVIPTRKTHMFSTASDNQSKAVFRIYEGERPLAEHSRLLAILEHKSIPQAPKGVPEIELSLEIDVNYVLRLEAVEKKSGKKETLVVDGSPFGDSEKYHQYDGIVMEAEEHIEEDQKTVELALGKQGENEFGVIAKGG